MKKYLSQTHPKLYSQLSITLNTISLATLSYGSKKKVWWTCEYGHNWQSTVCNRTGLGNGCPYCSGQKPTKSNSLSATHPHLLKSWHPKNTITPEEVMSKSNKKVWWICIHGHEWEEYINNRTRPNNNCPYCSGHRVCKTNCLSTTNPDLILEWSKYNKISPSEVTAGSNIKVQWECKKCLFIWQTRIIHRVEGHGCPKCRQSKGEQEIEKFLIKNQIKFKKQYRFKSCRYKRPLPFDFITKKHKLIAIEYQGEQHYSPIFGEKQFKMTTRNDLIKENWCKKHNLTLLKIHYSKFKQINEILCKI